MCVPPTSPDSRLTGRIAYDVYVWDNSPLRDRKVPRKVGFAWTQPNGYIRIELDALPVNGQLILEPQK